MEAAAPGVEQLPPSIIRWQHSAGMPGIPEFSPSAVPSVQFPFFPLGPALLFPSGIGSVLVSSFGNTPAQAQTLTQAFPAAPLVPIPAGAALEAGIRALPRPARLLSRQPRGCQGTGTEISSWNSALPAGRCREDQSR